jgi:hypothetical protein
MLCALRHALQRLRVLERRKGTSAAADRAHQMDLLNQVGCWLRHSNGLAACHSANLDS